MSDCESNIDEYCERGGRLFSKVGLSYKMDEYMYCERGGMGRE